MQAHTHIMGPNSLTRSNGSGDIQAAVSCPREPHRHGCVAPELSEVS